MFVRTLSDNMFKYVYLIYLNKEYYLSFITIYLMFTFNAKIYLTKIKNNLFINHTLTPIYMHIYI